MAEPWFSGQTTSPQKPRRRRVTLIIVLIILAAIIAFFGYRYWKSRQTAGQVTQSSDEQANRVALANAPKKFYYPLKSFSRFVTSGVYITNRSTLRWESCSLQVITAAYPQGYVATITNVNPQDQVVIPFSVMQRDGIPYTDSATDPAQIAHLVCSDVQGKQGWLAFSR